ncbi:MAG: hypothetical protein K2K63_08265 [Acetatifactor sp.]|nr:hypothetical protein [Acetatifactor sp.]
MDASVICFQLDLLIRLIDTTTGAELEERNVSFFRDGKPVRPIPRGSGNYVFLNCGREDGNLEIRARGYEPCQVSVEYEMLDRQLPVKEVFLIPSENMSGIQPIITFSGQLKGLESVQAVNLGSTCCCISEFDERKRIMKLFKTHRSGMDDIYYGLIHPDKQTYEPFEVVKEVSESSIKISQPLQEPFSVNSPIARIIFGMTTPKGNYLIRVRDDATRLLYLVRYVVKGSVKFKTVDFHNLEEEKLI